MIFLLVVKGGIQNYEEFIKGIQLLASKELSTSARVIYKLLLDVSSSAQHHKIPTRLNSSGAQPRSLYLTIYCKKHNLGTQWNRDSLKPKLAVKIGAAIGLIGT
ncbi:hypothetical protein ACOSP7_000682 [Xanthoceras sorbifolium]